MAAVTRAERALGRSGRALQGGHDGAHEAECKLENKHPNTQTYDQFLQVAVGIVLLAAVARFLVFIASVIGVLPDSQLVRCFVYQQSVFFASVPQPRCFLRQLVGVFCAGTPLACHRGIL